ncbi:gamma-butyrobetaine dioxygenase [Limimonas halophila]|uniref:Gamma-butyrobetaine dioxygenase n=1 Tax=Limimonas halophila TaxID=1082479 RepID=A0A1G7TWR1_9PROT|nr:TauD/TfdA family dioxygenase [Limimonas halophila]SDG39169.1 gamma-butyrobetaine dioxygenase [Limimonas halophila]
MPYDAVTDAAPVVVMGELEPYASPHRLTGARVEGDRVAVTWDDGREARFHRIWLRDHCPCSACRHPQTRERTFDLVDYGPVPQPAAEVTPDGALGLLWPEGGGHHESLFDPGWLRLRDDSGGPAGGDGRGFWDAAGMQTLPQVSWTAMTTTDAGLRTWLENLSRYGIALITDGPTEGEEVLGAVERIGWPRETNFGRMFDVVSKPNPNNAAYTAIKLEPHVDLPNWQRPPDFQFLYCLENAAEGGASLLTDGFAVAEQLKREDPEAFEVLASQPVDFRFQDETADIAFRAPTVGRDADGALSEIRFNNWIRDKLRMPADTVPVFYRAYVRFWELLRDPRFMIRFQLQPGQMIGFDNLRVLHGRESFDPNTGRRHLQGAYVDRDLVNSRLRVLQRGGA